MNGKFPARHGITDWIGAKAGWEWTRNGRVLPCDYDHHLDHGDITLAEALQAAGFATFFAGKWHLGSEGSLPTDHGFDENAGGYLAGSPRGGYFSPYKNPQLADGPPGESLPLRLALETARFMERHQADPFFAFLSFYSVHSPIQTSQPLWDKYRRRAPNHEGNRFIVDRTLPVRQVQDNPIYGGMMESLDQAVGIVLEALDRLELRDNTIVIFTSDNGGVSSGDAYATSNLPLRGGKGRQWEGGIRAPYYIVAPGVTRAESTCVTPVTGADFYPTLLDLVGLPPNDAQHVDGTTLVPLLKGEAFEDRTLYWHYPHYGNQGGEPCAIARHGQWKLIHYWEDRRSELYDLSRDPSETTDIANQHPERVTAMYNDLVGFLSSAQARIPARDPRFDEHQEQEQARRIRDQRLPDLERRHARFLDPNWQPNATWWDSQIVAD